jgi:hypothetical protein
MEEERRLLGEEHPETLRSMTDVSLSLSGIGRTTEAVGVGEKTMQLHQRVLGPGHSATLTAMNNVSNYCHDARRTNEAVELAVKVMEQCQKVSGDKDPDIPSYR